MMPYLWVAMHEDDKSMCLALPVFEGVDGPRNEGLHTCPANEGRGITWTMYVTTGHHRGWTPLVPDVPEAKNGGGDRSPSPLRLAPQLRGGSSN